MPEACSVLLVFRKAETAARLGAALQSAGFRVAAACGSGGEALRAAASRSFEIAVVGGRLPDMTGLRLCADLMALRDCGAILLGGESEKEYAGRAAENGDIVCLARPVTPSALVQAVDMCHRYRLRTAGLRSERDRLKKSLERRTLVERAKYALMEVRKIPEADAFRMMQKASMDTGIPMAEIAQSVLRTDGKRLFGPE